ncbi:hypothetical protein DSC45_31990 [Streptomyces sp. YIM 130001]|uniref:DUF397 domain-containing protein n=1 Tax=Streptomyces sp. YIM 130001 TaxID=2259644 RepID=UPI000E64F8C5|nr:DUF397 domain-containing protein [Streptomyces sp. YIM 130001]RII09146.1 hypothetical protein DSC45_31990 [Streptomyces sp. YIM 130001]
MTSTLRWFRSSYSDSSGGQCVEVAHDWHKSSYSASSGSDCVEIAGHPTAIHIRDSKQPDEPHLTVAPATWTDFLATWSEPSPASP